MYFPTFSKLIPVLIWNTTYTGEIYVRTYLRSHPPPPTRREEDLLWDNATRIASFALLLESFASLSANLVFPLLLQGRLAVPGLTLRRLWIASHILFALLMWSTLFITTVEIAVAMVAAAGISWALTLWAPFALIAQCVSHINDVSRRESIASSRSGTPDLRPVDGSPYGSTGPSGISVSNPDERRLSHSTPLLAPQPGHPVSRHSLLNPHPGSPKVPEKEEITSAGTILGLHNVFISSPQFISTLLASVIFHFLGAGGRGDDIHPETEPTLETQSSRSIAWVLSAGGIGGLVAAYLTWRLDEEVDAFGHAIE
jgi:solute carrier family 45, member 1/2/4